MTTTTLVLLAIAALVIVFAIVVALRPPGFRVARSAVINAPAPVVFGNISDFHRWSEWSPWEKLDPNLIRKFDGAPAGLGSIYSWKGSRKVGEGRMTIVESRPGELVRIKLEFIAPFHSTNDVEFTLKPGGSQTAVEWSMSGTCNTMLRAIGIFFPMDKMVGPDYERGLANLKRISEA